MVCAVLCGALLASCGDDEELQKQIIELRAKVEERNKTVEQLQAQVATLQTKAKVAVLTPTPEVAVISNAGAAANQELARANARITELEQQIASTPASSAPPPVTGKIDFDVIASHLEEDLAAKAKQLRQLVQRQSPSSRIDEISLKTIEYPPQLVTPFTSAITFTVTVGNAAPMKLMFPVTANLGGSWKLPTPDEIQKAYQAAKDQPATPVAAGEVQEAPTTRSKQATSPSPAAAATGSTLAGGAAPAAGGATTTTASGARMTQRADGVFVFDWGDGASAAGATVPNVAGPGRPATGAPTRPAVPAPAPAPAPAASPAPSRAGSAPPPVMPIVGDRVIRFDD